jgi:branched-chain amino acid transport system substrate-binding protein
MKNKSYVAIPFAVILVSTALIAIGAGRPRETVTFGALLALKGHRGGVDLRDGMMMAASEINKSGGINGSRLEILVADTQVNPERAQELFIESEERGEKGKPLLYVSMLSGVSTDLVPLADAYHVVLIGCVVTAPVFTELSDWVYRFYPKVGYEAGSIITIVKALGISDMGVLFVDDEYGRSVLDFLRENTLDINLSISSRGFAYGEQDLGSLLRGFEHMSAVYVVGFPDQVIRAVQVLRDMSYEGVILTNSSATVPWNRTDPSLEGVFTAAPTIYNPNFPFVRTFEADFKDTYKREISHYVANGYDCVKLLAGLLEGSELTRDNVRRILERGFSYVGVLGTVDLQAGDRDIEFPLFPARILGGNVVYDWEQTVR